MLRSLPSRLLRAFLFSGIFCGPALHLASAQSDPSSLTEASTATRLILVLPFENRSGQSNLAWIGDSFPDTLNQRLNSSGFLTITRDDRQYALDHLGLPVDFRPTRATTIRIAQTLDANFVILGSYTVSNGRISVQAQVLDVNRLSLSPPLDDSAELPRLLDVENAIAWKVARQLDPHFNVALQTFLSASSSLKLAAFEDYIRGIDASAPKERISHLQAAVQLDPAYSPALLALGKTLYLEHDYEKAAATLSKVPRTSRLALEANFFLGLARFNDGRYAEAQSAFAFVASRLPLAEVVNNEGVAASRQGHDAVALFQRASTSDPNDPDYHFNLAIALLQRGDAAASSAQLATTLKLRPSDSDALALQKHIAEVHSSSVHPSSTSSASPHASSAPAASSSGTTPDSPTHNSAAAAPGPSRPSANSAPDPSSADDIEPVPRIRRTYSEASFRQAAFELDQMRSLRMATLLPPQRAEQYVQSGRDYLTQGFLPEAEREFQQALAANPSSSAAHAGLAQIREQSGDPAQAIHEAQLSNQLQPNVPACLVLARIELSQNQLPASAADVARALRLEPSNTAALGIKQALASRGQSLP